MTKAEKHKHMADLALSVYAAHQALVRIEKIAEDAGLWCNNKQKMHYIHGTKAVTVLVNGEVK